MITEKPSPGQTFLHLQKVNPGLISASSLPPNEVYLEVVAVDDRDVWYKHDGKHRTEQTSIERFMENVFEIPEAAAARMPSELLDLIQHLERDPIPQMCFVVIIPKLLDHAQRYRRVWSNINRVVDEEKLHVVSFFKDTTVFYYCDSRQSFLRVRSLLKEMEVSSIGLSFNKSDDYPNFYKGD